MRFLADFSAKNGGNMRFNKFAKIFAVVLAIIMLASVFSACNFLDGLGVTKIENVDIAAGDGMGTPNSSGIYEVGVGGHCSLTIDWHSFMISNPTIRWYVATDGGERQEIEGQNGKTLSFDVTGGVGTQYEFSASANSVESKNTIKVVIVAGVKDVTIAIAGGLDTPNGSGQYEVEAGEEFSLTANWTETASGTKNVEWFVSTNGGTKQKNNQTTKTSAWNVVTVGTVYVISAAVNGVESSNSITVLVVDGDTPVVIAFTVQVTGEITDEDSDGYKEARFGDSFTVSADFGGLLVDDPTFDWFVAEDGVERKLADTEGSLTFTIESRDIQRYVFRAVLKGDDDVPSSNEARVDFVDFTLDQVALVTSLDVVGGKIQQNLNGSPEDVVITAVWNEAELPEDVVTFEWRVDNVQQAETTKSFTFDADSVLTACEKTVKVTIRYKAQTVFTTVVLSFVEEYLPVERVTLNVTQTSKVGWLGELRSTYKVNGATTDAPGSVTVSAVVTPDGTNLAADCTWTVRDMAGTRTLSDKTRSVTISLAYGKSVITASIENMESRSVIVYALTSSDLSARRSVIEDTFIWNGSVQDHYINNQEELNIFVGYLVSTHETSADYNGENVHTVYLAPSEWRDGVNVTPAFGTARSIAMQQGVDESGTPAISTYGNAKIYLMDSSVLGEPTEPIFTDYHVSQERVYVRYTTISDLSDERRNKVPADDFSETMLVKNSNQLVRALSWGYKPTFEDNAAGTSLALVYYAARNMLLQYIGKNMTDLEKVGIIYDWLVNEVDYDYAAYDYTGADSVSYNAYYLEGVFNDHRAVCDGKSKAFALLCGMEGIKAIRVIGTAGTNPNPEYWGGHAWNKVLVDADGDGVREWFAVDCTWGDIGMDTKTYHEKKEILTYEYFLTTDTHMAATHASDMAQPAAVTAFDPYETVTVKYLTETTTLDVTTREQLDVLYAYSLNHGKVKIRCRIADSAKSHIPAGGGLSSLTDDEEDVYYFYAS